MGEAQAATAAQSSSALAALEPSLRAWAVRATGDPEASRDLVQETLAAGLEAAGRFEGRSALRTWLIGVLSHKVADHFRKLYKTPFESNDPAPLDLHPTPSGSEVERVVMARRDLARVDRALAQLPPGERLALMLVGVEGFDHEEACREMAVTATHLRVLLHRGRHHLRRMLEREL
jgi:RNA polymerase sigma-70 factor (ECF subfamily)